MIGRCSTRSKHVGKSVPHLMTSFADVKQGDRWWEYEVCSWCAKGMPFDSVMQEVVDARRTKV